MSGEECNFSGVSDAYVLDGNGVQTPGVAASNKNHRKKRKGPTTFKKAPQAPKRFKSSYIFFSMAKMEELKKDRGNKKKVTRASTQIAEMWKKISDEERKKWDEIARKDKIRYMAEKALYTGPWQVPSKRVKKDPSAPKRPMSAFLFFSQGKRQKLKGEKPQMKNTEISTILGEMWKNLSEEDRLPYVEREEREREQYKKDIALWRSKRADEDEAEKMRKDGIVSEYIKSGFVQDTSMAVTAPPTPVPMPEGPGIFPRVPAAMPPGMMPFPPMVMPPGMPPAVPMPLYPEGTQHTTEKDQQQQGEQIVRQGTQPIQPPYSGFCYYPIYSYPYPMPVPSPGVAPVCPTIPTEPQQTGAVDSVPDATANKAADEGN